MYTRGYLYQSWLIVVKSQALIIVQKSINSEFRVNSIDFELGKQKFESVKFHAFKSSINCGLSLKNNDPNFSLSLPCRRGRRRFASQRWSIMQRWRRRFSMYRQQENGKYDSSRPPPAKIKIDSINRLNWCTTDTANKQQPTNCI